MNVCEHCSAQQRVCCPPLPSRSDVSRADTPWCWKFNAALYTQDELCEFLVVMFGEFNIGAGAIRVFVRKIKDMYLNVPYHNFTHAFDVTQSTFWLVVQPYVRSILSNLEITVVLLAAMCHDVGHPGLNNAFHSKTNSELAQKYNNESILENYHYDLAIQLLHDPSVQIFQDLSSSEKEVACTLLKKCILATDLAKHFGYLGEIQALSPGGLDKSNVEHRQLFCACLLKWADISNVARPWDVYLRWEAVLMEEMMAQGDKEAEAGVEVSPNFDRATFSERQKKIPFMVKLVIPFFSEMARAFPELNTLVDHVEQNQKLADEYLKEKGL